MEGSESPVSSSSCSGEDIDTDRKRVLKTVIKKKKGGGCLGGLVG